MKIGVLTYYGDLNCGTNLQAYATLSAVRQVYPYAQVEIIPFHGFRQYNHPYFSNCTFTSIIRDIKRMYKYSNYFKKQLGIKKDKTILAIPDALSYIANRNYDAIYVGADTLLELNRIPKDHQGLSAYWLSPQIQAHKVLLAASSKNVEEHNLTPQQREEMAAAVQSYTAIGVRDTATQTLLSNFVKPEQISLIPDPTFSLPIDYSHVEKYLKRRKINLSDKCICIHCYKTDTWASEVAQELKKEGYLIASLRPMPWADVVLNDMSPLEQAGIFRSFKLIITHRFHEGIYAIKNGTPPLLYVNSNTNLKTSSGNSKYQSLMETFDLYPSNVIDRGEITAQSILKQIPLALKEFNEKKSAIEDKVVELKGKYIDFLQESKKIIEANNGHR